MFNLAQGAEINLRRIVSIENIVATLPSNLSDGGGGKVSQDVNVVALVKGEERYIFLFNDEKKGETLRTLGKYASNPDLSFSWYDAAVLSQKVRRAVRQKASELPESNLASQTDAAVSFHNAAQSDFDDDDFGSNVRGDDFREFEDFLGEEPTW